MTSLGTESNPLRVAIIGSGPAAFYAVEALQKQTGLVAQIDMFDRLPTPYGLVRYGVAPDHQKIKSVTKLYEKLATNPRFRFFGNVEFGKHVTVADLRQYYHQILYATGAQSDRRMGIPGEDLNSSHPATEFVAWYNGHPDYRDCKFDLSCERAAVVGVGNVAIDVARILSRTPKELQATDMADYAIEALRNSKVKEVYLLGRRGPAQAAFTNPEVKELAEMEDADVFTLPNEVQLDELSQAEIAHDPDPLIQKKVEMLQSYAQHQPSGKARRFYIRFLVSPTELVSDGNNHVTRMHLVHNTLVKSETGTLSAQATDKTEDIDVGLVFRSVGYRGLPLPDVPFHERWAVILNEGGRVINPDTKQPRVGEYTSGWIKRGPSGVIGTNKPDSVETVNAMMADLQKGSVLSPEHPEVDYAEEFVSSRQPKYVTFADWLKIDKLEVENGAKLGRPRVKITSVEEMLKVVGK
ncbi:MAG: FAD-dependent oxidoreductase [Chloroflexi bacterium]|nr:FAD-dependent oxidoreductase [Chloroflexota bacterium]